MPLLLVLRINIVYSVHFSRFDFYFFFCLFARDSFIQYFFVRSVLLPLYRTQLYGIVVDDDELVVERFFLSLFFHFRLCTIHRIESI